MFKKAKQLIMKFALVMAVAIPAYSTIDVTSAEAGSKRYRRAVTIGGSIAIGGLVIGGAYGRGYNRGAYFGGRGYYGNRGYYGRPVYRSGAYYQPRYVRRPAYRVIRRQHRNHDHRYCQH